MTVVAVRGHAPGPPAVPPAAPGGPPPAVGEPAFAQEEELGGVAVREVQYITFAVSSEEYGIGILAVREIRGWSPVSKLPNMPHYVCGVMNLRGIVIPIYDLRARFGGGATVATPRHVVIVVQTGRQMRGILVDAISDILPIRHKDIQPPPSVEAGVADAAYLMGIYAVADRMVAVLDVEALFEDGGNA